jgi:hypothetical protein
MGCDIHVLIEAKTSAGWHCVHHPRIERWYSLFSRMADVRNNAPGGPHYIQPISKPRGLPDDVSEIARILLDDGNHSSSWLSAPEWESICSDERYSGDGRLSEVVPYEIDSVYRDERILDYRVVFAFDN